MVSRLSIVMIIVNMILGVLIPVVLMVSFKKKYKASIKSFLVGCATMLFFAMVLEQLVHSVVLGSAVGAVIQGNIWLYALYASLMAGLFEETEGSREAAFLICELLLNLKKNIFCEKKLHKKYLVI